MQKYLRISAPLIEEDDIQAVSEALRKDIITRGPLVEAFEAAFAEFVGAKGAVAFNSGTSALMAAYDGVETSIHDHIITTPNTFIGTVTGAYLKKAQISYVDVDFQTANIDIYKAAQCMNKSRTRGKEIIVPVHFAGQSLDMALLESHVKNPDTVIIEDACHAIGSKDPQGNKVGACTYSTMTVFSFHPNKNMTTTEGGIVTCNDAYLLEKLRAFRGNGIVKRPSCSEPWFYEVQAFSGNYHFTEIQAALGLSQLKKVPLWIEKREALRACYLKEIESCRAITALSCSVADTASHLFVVLIDFEALGKSRTHVMEALASAQIQTQVHYIPLYRHPAIACLNQQDVETFVQTEHYYSQALSLPFHCAMDHEDARRVVAELKKVLS